MLTGGLLVLAALAGPANAATELGQRCIASAGAPSQVATNPTAQSFVIPTNGVVTRWGFNFVPSATSFPVHLATLRGSGSDWTLTGLSEKALSVSGENSNPTRMSVSAGDRIGIADTIVYCVAAGEQIQLGAFVGGTTVGSPLSLPTNAPNFSPSVWATLEPDVDLDGYGDETQDLCPQSATFQISCPIPGLSVFRIRSVSSFRALVTTSIATTVVASGSVKLPAAKGKRAKTLKFKTKAAKTGPGKLTSINLKWPRSLTNALGALSSGSSLKAKIKLTADGVLTDTTKNFTVKLKGRG